MWLGQVASGACAFVGSSDYLDSSSLAFFNSARCRGLRFIDGSASIKPMLRIGWPFGVTPCVVSRQIDFAPFPQSSFTYRLAKRTHG